MWSKNTKANGKTAKIDTLIGQNSELHGDVVYRGGLHVDGTIRGNVFADPDSGSVMSLSEHGVIEGEIRAPHVLLNGTVIGDVYVTEHIELASHARINGNVYYKIIEIARGAEVNGSLIRCGDDELASKQRQIEATSPMLLEGKDDS